MGKYVHLKIYLGSTLKIHIINSQSHKAKVKLRIWKIKLYYCI